MLQPANLSKPFIVGDVGLEKISMTPCGAFTTALGAFKCLMIKSSSFIIDLIGLLVDVAAWVVVVSSKTLPCSKSSMKLVKFDEIFLKSGITLFAGASSALWVVWFMGKVKVFSVEVTFDLCSWIAGAVETRTRKKKRMNRRDLYNSIQTGYQRENLYRQEAFVGIHYFWVAIHWQLWTLHHKCSPSD